MQLPEQDASRHLLHAFWAVRQRIDARVGVPLAAATGMDLMEFVLLEYAAMTDLSPTEIAATVRVPEHTVSRRLGTLERSGLLHRRIDPDDARRRVLVLTGGGRARLADARAELHARLGPMIDDLGPARLSALLDALTAFAAADDTVTEPAARTVTEHEGVATAASRAVAGGAPTPSGSGAARSAAPRDRRPGPA